MEPNVKSKDQNMDGMMKDAEKFTKNSEKPRAFGGNGCLAVILLVIVIFLTIVMVSRCAG